MRIAYLILAHNTPNHLRRLVASLSSPSSSSFIHLDRKSDALAYRGIEGRDVRFTADRVPVYWGDYSQVEATLLLLRTALEDDRSFERFVLLSGSDYPLRSASYIEQFFERNAETEFMNLVMMPSREAGKPISRLTTYQVRPGESALSHTVHRLLLRLRLLPRQRDYRVHLRDLVPYGGSTWWALSREACEYIVAFSDREVDVVAFFKNTVCPDESYFQTVLGNSPFASRIARNLTYADWSRGGSGPTTLDKPHLTFFRATSSFDSGDVYGAGEMLFARKFGDDSGTLVAELDKLIRDRERPSSGG